MKQFYDLKEELKAGAKELREKKNLIKKYQREKNHLKAGIGQSRILGKRWEWRHKHIAYSMMKGKSYGQIERSCRTHPNSSKIAKILSDYGYKMEGDLALDSRAIRMETGESELAGSGNLGSKAVSELVG